MYDAGYLGDQYADWIIAKIDEEKEAQAQAARRPNFDRYRGEVEEGLAKLASVLSKTSSEVEKLQGKADGERGWENVRRLIKEGDATSGEIDDRLTKMSSWPKASV